jgi:hypothetical protein
MRPRPAALREAPRSPVLFALCSPRWRSPDAGESRRRSGASSWSPSTHCAPIHVGAYGYPRDTTPFLDRLAERGVLFRRVVSASSNTAPAHASLLTSLQPFQHGGAQERPGTARREPHASELLAAAGLSVGRVHQRELPLEICQGFDHVDAQWRTGDLTVDAAIAWLDTRRPIPGRSSSGCISTTRTSSRGRAKSCSRTPICCARREEKRREFLSYLAARGVEADFYPDEATLLERYDVYDAGVRFADRQIERLYRRVEAERPAARVVTSDHGEGLGNHRYDDHGSISTTSRSWCR